MRIIASALFIAYLGVVAILVLGVALDIGNWHPGSDVTADQVFLLMLILLVPFFLGIFIGKHQS